MHLALKVSAIGLALVAGFYGPQVVTSVKESMSQHQMSSESINLDDYCMLSSAACEQNSVRISLDRDVTQPLVPAKIRVEWPNAKQDSLSLNLQGLEMEMGSARYRLNSVGNDVFEGEIILPVCTLDKMTWVGELTDGQTTVKPALRMAR
ncbi:hypothetical protein EK599_06940 [Vibrio sp. T187]|uniref:hypothetical protein n=1 Tax=Vibrio TaxID=662 RepID=UPI0010C9D89F|nr:MULTISPECIES: hypothetical protein [Vibrio]MBW3695424.1 hypothetical protein [Vibrio sp. T187]